MDYLPHPRTQHYPVQVPLLFGTPAYDNLSFEDFPRRCGWDIAKLVKGDLDGKHPSKSAALLQQWLYFGVIATTFALAELPFTRSEFMMVEDGRLITVYLNQLPRRKQKRLSAAIRRLELDDYLVLPDHVGHPEEDNLQLFITGRPLVAGLQKLEEMEREASQEQRVNNFQRINSCVDTALAVLRTLMEAISAASANNDDDQRDLLRAILPGEIELSTALLLETLKYKMVEIYGLRLFLRPQSSDWLFDRMGDMGWCRALLSELLHRNGLRFIYYGYVLGAPPSTGLDHSACRGKRCVANNVEEASYVTKHIDRGLNFKPRWWELHLGVVRRVHHAWHSQGYGAENNTSACNCGHLGPNPPQLKDILERGGIPLISIKPPRLFDSRTTLIDLQLEVVEWDPTIPYIAISHVWSDGLGNPKTNTLPLCQLLEIRNVLLAARADIPDAKSWITSGLKNILLALLTSPKRLYFWMDTLCVPVSPVTRKMAIRRMADCYNKADIVLVRDSSMMRCSSSVPPDEILFRLTLSAWVRRMWTFQEAVLGRRIIVQLSDGYERPIHLPIYSTSWKKNENVVTTQNTVKNLLQFSLTVVGLKQESLSASRRLFAIVLSLATRTTSKQQDEALCITTLLGRGIDEVLSAEDDRRWLALLSVLKEFMSPTVIFMRCPKMVTEGYRWAPSTFLDLEKESELANMIRRDDSTSPPVEFSDRGILVRFPGMLLKTIPKPLTSVFCLESYETKQRFWSTTGILQDGTTSWNNKEPPVGSHYALVMQKIPNENANAKAVLLSECSLEGDVIHGAYVCVLNVERLLREANRPPYVNEQTVWGWITSIENFKDKCWFPDIEQEYSMQTWCIR